jgi:hypothetical protein
MVAFLPQAVSPAGMSQLGPSTTDMLSASGRGGRFVEKKHHCRLPRAELQGMFS